MTEVLFDIANTKAYGHVIINSEDWHNPEPLVLTNLKGKIIPTNITTAVGINPAPAYRPLPFKVGDLIALSGLATRITSYLPFKLPDDPTIYSSTHLSQVIGYFVDNKVDYDNFIPIYDKVMFKPIEVKQSDFLYLSDDNLSVGVVVKTGDGGFNDDWDRVPMNFKIGDVVLVRDNVSTRVTLGQEDYYVVDDKFIMGKFESEDKLNIEDLKLCEGVHLFEEYEDDTIEGSTLYKVPMGDEDDISQTYQNMLFKLVKSDEVPEGIYYINRIDTEYVKFKNKTYFVARKDRIMAKRAEN